MTKEVLMENAAIEFDNIKLNANPKEIERLKNNVEFLHGNFPKECVYGILTGDCFSPRAAELITQCSQLIFFDDLYRANEKALEEIVTVGSIKGEDDTRNFSSLEMALFLYKKETSNLVREKLGLPIEDNSEAENS